MAAPISRLLLATLLSAGALAARPASAQIVADSSMVTRLLEYEAEKKSPWVAVALNLLPPAGHLYAGHTVRGLLPAALVWGGAMAAASLQGECVEWDPFWSFCTQYEHEDSLSYQAATVALVGGFIWGMVDGYNLTKAHNRRLRERLRLTVQPVTTQALQFRFEYRP